MLDFRRDRGSNEDKRQEMLNAYLDNALTPAERARFEAQLARDPRLRAEVEQLRVIKLQLRAMPRRRVPRSFALNPATYARPKAQPLLQLYPALRGATALAAFLFIFVLALGVFRGQFGAAGLPAPSAAGVEVTRLVGEEDAATFEGVEQTAPEEEAAAIEAAAPAEATVREAEEQPAAEMAAAEAPEAVTEEAAEVAGAAAPEGTTAPIPETELVLPSPEATSVLLDEAAPEESEAAGEEAAFDATLTVVAPTVEAIAEAAPPAAETDAAAQAPDAGTDILLLLQIGLGVLFLVLLILWWLARRRARSF